MASSDPHKNGVSNQGPKQTIAAILALAFLYFALGKLSFYFSVSEGIVTRVVFFSEGVSLAAAILLGPWIWPGVFLGQLALALSSALPWPVAIAIAMINSGEAVLGAFIFRRFRLSPSFGSLRDLTGVFLLITLVLQPLSATLGTGVLRLGGLITGGQYIDTWVSWWLGNFLGQQLLVPLICSLVSVRNSSKSAGDFGIGYILLSLFTWSLFFSPLIPNFFTSCIVFFPFFVWFAARYGLLLMGIGSVVLTLLLLVAAHAGLGPYAGVDRPRLLELDFFICGVTLLGQFVSVGIAEMRESKVRYENILKAVPGVIYEFVYRPQRAGWFTYLSPGCRDLLEVDPEALLQDIGIFYKMLDPEDRVKLKALGQIASESQEMLDVEIRLTTPSGIKKWIRLNSIRRTKDAEGFDLRTGFILDVTDRKTAEMGLSETRIFKERVLAQSPFGILVYRNEGQCIYANESSASIIGGTVEKVLAQNFRSLESWRTLGLAAVADEVFETRKPQRIEKKIRSSFGKDAWVHFWFSIFTQEGTDHLLLMFGDCTLQHELTDRLENARFAAEEANRAKGEFLSNMSHEIRTPLNTIIGLTELIDDGPLNEDQQKQIHSIHKSSETLLELINNILEVSTIEAGAQPLKPESIHLGDLLSEVQAIVGPKIVKKGLQYRQSLVGDVPPWIVLDPLRLKQVLINVLNNAAKFTEEGSISLVVSRRHQETVGEVIDFSVIDTGIGIPKGKLSALFQRFNQLDTSVTRKYGGSGLGLHISSQLVKQMGGVIKACPTQGGGTEFFFSLPLLKGEPRVASNPVQKPLLPTDTRRLKLLIVDDAEDNRILLQAYLKSYPYELVFAKDGLQAFEAFQEHQFHLVLMDIQMPVMDGLTATKKIRNWETENQHQPRPIVALTANALDEDRAQTRAAGCNAHATKPIRRAELIKLILEMCPPAAPAA